MTNPEDLRLPVHLRPCPCGSRKLTLQIPAYADDFSLICHECGVRKIVEYSALEAAHRWSPKVSIEQAAWRERSLLNQATVRGGRLETIAEVAERIEAAQWAAGRRQGLMARTSPLLAEQRRKAVA